MATRRELKITHRLIGQDNVDEFTALCFVLKLRPHQLLGQLVTEGVARYREDPDLDEDIRQLCQLRQQHLTHISHPDGNAGNSSGPTPSTHRPVTSTQTELPDHQGDTSDDNDHRP